MDVVRELINDLPVVVGIALLAIALGGRVPLVAGLTLIILGVLL